MNDCECLFLSSIWRILCQSDAYWKQQNYILSGLDRKGVYYIPFELLKMCFVRLKKPILGDRIRSKGKNNKARLVLCIPPVLNIIHYNLSLNTSDKRNWIPLLPPAVPIAQRHVQRTWRQSRFFSSYLKSGADLSDWRSQRHTP